jgi:hypothetical protein
LFFEETTITERLEKGKSYHTASVYKELLKGNTYKCTKKKTTVNALYRVQSETQEIPVNIVASVF